MHPTARHAKHSVSFKLFVPLSQKKNSFSHLLFWQFFFSSEIRLAIGDVRNLDIMIRIRSTILIQMAFFPKKNLIQTSDISIYEKSGVGMWRFHLNHRFIDQHAKH